MTTRRRIDRLSEILGDADGLLVTSLPNIRYLTGFTGSTALFTLTPEGPFLIVDSRYFEQAGKESDIPVLLRKGRIEDSLRDWLPGVTRCALEADHVTQAQWNRLQKCGEEMEIEFVAREGLVEGLRIVKDEEEVAALRRSAALLETLFERLLKEVRVGRKEIEVAVIFEAFARHETCRPLPFEPIVASGPRAALPHGVASRKVLESGELVVIDIGLDLDGYVADMTRTVALGEPKPEHRRVYEIVREANETAANSIRPDLSGEEAHNAAAKVIAEAGYADHFGHGLGHGVGIEVHEEPRLAPNVSEKLREGMVFTIEPGIYLPEDTGVRIEDTGVLRKDGVEIFNRLTHDLIVL
ncbi:MAG: aminopeptidase P family protein [Candidatus Hydrogenedentota bacterium]|nr:MAG: aminopeptidase P family protein [Candidatus Hydrogenedentota bacterium]